MSQKFANAARAELAATINDTDTTISVVDFGALFPVANTDTAAISESLDWFKLTIQDKDNYEIVFVRTHASGSNEFSNVLRGQEGTVARSFLAGSIVGLRPTAGDAASVLASLGDKADKAAQELAGGVDLNTIQTPGFYVQSENVEAASGANYPVAQAGAHVVLKNASGVSQLYYTYGSAVVAPSAFFRAFYNVNDGTWSAWQEIYHSGNLGAASETASGIVELATTAEVQAGTDNSRAVTPAGLAAGGAPKLRTARTLTIGNTGKSFDGSANVSWSLDEIGAARFGSLADGTDLNTVVKPGFYRLLSSHGNAPSGVSWGQLIVSRGGGDTILQIVTGYDNGEIYWRQGNPPDVGGGGSWSAWHRFFHSGNLTGVMSGNGYQKLPGGLIIQWGTTGTVLVDGSLSVTFPIAFPTACASVVAQQTIGKPDTGVNIPGWAVSSKSTTGFTVQNDEWTQVFYWIAIGY